MTLQRIEPAEPNLDPRTKEDQLQNIILYQEELMKYEIERGNDLCEIIMSFMDNDGPSKLTKPQKERVNSIRRNIETRKKWTAR